MSPLLQKNSATLMWLWWIAFEMATWHKEILKSTHCRWNQSLSKMRCTMTISPNADAMGNAFVHAYDGRSMSNLAVAIHPPLIARVMYLSRTLGVIVDFSMHFLHDRRKPVETNARSQRSTSCTCDAIKSRTKSGRSFNVVICFSIFNKTWLDSVNIAHVTL